MKDEFNRVHGKLDSIEESINSIDKTLVKQQVILDEHIKRTHILEQELLPIKAHVEQLRGVGKFIFYASLVATILTIFFMWK